jgi:hypothetical protein
MFSSRCPDRLVSNILERIGAIRARERGPETDKAAYANSTRTGTCRPAAVHELLCVTVVKVKLKLSLCLTKHHPMKTYGGVEVQLHPFLTSAVGAGESSASRSARFTPWLGGPESRSGRGGEKKYNLRCPCREWSPGRPASRQCADWVTLPILALRHHP